MRQNYEKLFNYIQSPEPPPGLFERVMKTLRKEQESRQKKRFLFSFSVLLAVSFAAAPLSWNVFINQIESSGISHFISAAFADIGTFFALWQDFTMAVLETLPLLGLAALAGSLCLSVFTIRFFLRGRKLLLVG